MIFHLTDRRGLLDFLSVREEGARLSINNVEFSQELVSALERAENVDSLVLVWDDEASLNSLFDTFVIVVADRGYEEFLAWTHTYIGDFKPFTSFFRVVKASDIERFDVFERPLPWLPRRILDAFAAVSIAEAAVQLAPRARGLSTQQCVLTFSFAAMKSLYSGLHPSQIVDLSERWDSVRHLGASSPRLAATEALSFWLLATSSLLSESQEERADDWMAHLGEVIRSAVQDKPRAADHALWSNFPSIENSIRAFDEASGLPRDQQLRVLDRAADTIRSSATPHPLKEAILGLLVARLANGSMDYLRLVLEFGDEYICAPLWFAFFSGFQKGFDGLTYSNALGRHLVRRAAIRRSVFDKSSVFLSFDELLLMSRTKNTDHIQSTFGSVVEVELLPGVSVPVPNPSRKTEEETTRRTDAVDKARLSRLLKEALLLLDRAEDYERGPPTARSGDLFGGSEAKPQVSGKRRKTR